MKRFLAALFFLLAASQAHAQNVLPSCNWGDLLYRGQTGWLCVPYDNTPYKFLQGNGASAAPTWTFQAPQSFLLPTQSTNTILGNVTGGSASPSPITVSQALDTTAFASLSPQAVAGTVLYRGLGSLGWQFLAPGTAGQVLATGGPVNPPYWAAGGAGTVTSVGLTVPSELSVTGSPVTDAGTLGVTWSSQSGNLVFASPDGMSGTPTFRALTSNDITAALPSASTYLDTLGSTRGALLYRGASGWTILAPGTSGRLLTSNGTGADPSWGTVPGAVSSVGLSMPPIFTVTNSPITTSGTLTATLNTQAQNTVFIGPSSGADAAPTFRFLAGADLPNPGASSLGGVQSKAVVASNYLTGISTSGVVTAAQPACANLSNGAASCSTDTTNAANISSGTLLAARMPALTGDVTTTVGAIATTIATNAVQNTQFRQSGALSLVGRSANSSGNVADISAVAASDCAYRESSSTLGCGTLATAAYANSSITYAKIQNISATQLVLGRNTAGAGVTEEVTTTQLLDWIGSTQGNLLYRNGTVWTVLAPGTSGQVLQSGGAGGNLSWLTVTGSGTVTSVNMTVPSIMAVSGNPITGAGTLAVTLATETANTVFAGGTSGGAATPTFRALVGADLPNPSSSTLGGVQSKAAVGSQWITSISTSGVPALAQPAESDLSFTDITTNNASTTKHGFAPKYPNDATKYLDGTGAYSTPAAAATYQIPFVQCGAAASATRFCGFGIGASPTETDVQWPMPKAGTLNGLSIYTTANVGGAAQSVVYTIRKNAVDTTLTCTIASGASTCSDTAHTVSYSANDKIDIKYAAGVIVGTAISDIMLSSQ